MKNSLLMMLASVSLLLGACSTEGDTIEIEPSDQRIETEEVLAQGDAMPEPQVEEEGEELSESDSEGSVSYTNPDAPTSNTAESYRQIEVDGGNTSGHREGNVMVDIGFGDRVYWAFTNEHGQLVRVIADEIIVQNDATEPVTSDGRYYSRMADVPGVGAANGYDRGHVIADSLGGVANAYNITPQEATLNRHGDQAYMEKVIRDAGGATDFEAIITYPNTSTQIPSHYKYTYTIRGNRVTDEFANVNPDKLNEELGLTDKGNNNVKPSAPASEAVQASPGSEGGQYVDDKGNGLIKGSNSGIYHTPNSSHYERTKNVKQWFKSIKEAEAAGYRAPKR